MKEAPGCSFLDRYVFFGSVAERPIIQPGFVGKSILRQHDGHPCLKTYVCHT